MVEEALEMRGPESTGLQRANQVGTALGTAPYSSGLDWKQERQAGRLPHPGTLLVPSSKRLQGIKHVLSPDLKGRWGGDIPISPTALRNPTQESPFSGSPM